MQQVIIKGRQDVGHVTLIDHMTVTIDDIVKSHKHCECQVFLIVYIIYNYVKQTSLFFIYVPKNPNIQFFF